MYKKIGILGAMDDEISQIYSIMTDKKASKAGGVEFYEGRLADKDVVLCCAGMGKTNAAAATQLLITVYKADAVVMCGIAGNMTGKIGVGDAVISSDVVYHDAENRMIAEVYPHMQVFKADAALIAAAEKACAGGNLNYITGRIATGDLFIGETAVKKRIETAFSPLCVEMEGAAVAHVALKNDVPFIIVRIMSDNADEEGAQQLVGKPFDISEFIRDATLICSGICKNI